MVDRISDKGEYGLLREMPEIFGLGSEPRLVTAEDADRIAEYVRRNGWNPDQLGWLGQWVENRDRFIHGDALRRFEEVFDDSRFVPGRTYMARSVGLWSVADLIKGRIPRGAFGGAMDAIASNLFEGRTGLLARGMGIDEVSAARYRGGRSIPEGYAEVRRLAAGLGFEAAEVLSLTWLAESVVPQAEGSGREEQDERSRHADILISAASLMLGNPAPRSGESIALSDAVRLTHFAIRSGFHAKTSHVVMADYCLLRMDEIIGQYSSYVTNALKMRDGLRAATASMIASLFMEERAGDERGALGMAAVLADQGADLLAYVSGSSVMDDDAVTEMREALYRRALALSSQMAYDDIRQRIHPGFMKDVEEKLARVRGEDTPARARTASDRLIDEEVLEDLTRRMSEEDAEAVRDVLDYDSPFFRKMVHSDRVGRIVRRAVKDARRTNAGGVISPVFFNASLARVAGRTGIFSFTGSGSMPSSALKMPFVF